MKQIQKYKSFLLPVFLCWVIASFYVVMNPGAIGGDASEYDRLSDSILVGQYSIDGIPSMIREPGYPIFRAGLKLIHFSGSSILWIQTILYALTVFFIGLTCFKIDNKIGTWGVWGAALSYGLAFYPSHHLSETLTAFLLSLVGLLIIIAIDNPRLRYWIYLGIAIGATLLTRYAFLFVPIFSTIALIIFAIKNKTVNRKKVAINIVLMFLVILLIISPWIIRNYNKFGEANIAGRSGSILYAKAWKIEKPWRSLFDSYVSVFLGRGILFTIYPTNQSIFQEQWGDWWSKPDRRLLWGKTEEEMNKNRRKAAIAIIFKNFNQFSKFVVWSGVDGLRSIALPNPIFEAEGSPIEGTYGPLAKAEGLSLIQILALAFVHIVQLFWFVFIILSTYLGFKKYSYRFIPGILFFSFILPHTLIDGTARFGVPIQPWLLAGIFITILYPSYLSYRERFEALRQS